MSNLKTKERLLAVLAGGSLCVALVAGMLPNTNTHVPSLGEVITVKNGELQSVMSYSERLDAFTDAGLKKIQSVYGDASYGLDMVGVVGNTIPDTTLNLINGKTLNTADFKGKPYVIEVVASWCDYCKKTVKESLRDIVSKNTDLEVVQIFAEGNTADVHTLYEQAGVSVDEFKYIVPADDAAISFVGNLGITGFPMWIFVDADGRISWTHSGYAGLEDFSTLRDEAYTGDRIYNLMNEDFDLGRTAITPDTVYDTLTMEAIEGVNSVEAAGSYMLYSNLGRKFEGFKAKDIDGKEFDFASLEGKKVMIDIEVASDEFSEVKANAKVAEDLAKVAKENEIETIQVWLPSYEKDTLVVGKDYRKKTKIETPYGKTFDITEEQGIEEIYEFDIYSVPSQIYLNEDGRVVGTTSGTLTSSRMQSAIDLYYAEKPLYKQVTEEAIEKSNELMKEDGFPVKTATLIVSLITFVLSGIGFVLTKSKSNKLKKFEEFKQTPVKEETENNEA